jgi:hypothetical protein
VPAERGTAYGTYNAVLGVLDFCLGIAGILWQGIGGWHGLGPSAPFLFGGVMALLAALLLGISGIGRAPRALDASRALDAP